MSQSWSQALKAENLPPLGQWPTCEKEEKDNVLAAEARTNVFEAKSLMEKAKAILAKTEGEVPAYVIRNKDVCPGGAHTCGGWCLQAEVHFSPPREGEKTYNSRLVAEREALRRNTQRERDWQDFLNC